MYKDWLTSYDFIQEEKNTTMLLRMAVLLMLTRYVNYSSFSQVKI